MTESDYRALPGVNFSTLKTMAVSPMAYRAALETPRADTPALSLGRAVHCAVLEPDWFDSRYVVRPAGIDRRTKDGKAAWEAFVSDNAGKQILDAEEHATAIAVRDAVMRHPAAARRLAEGKAEQVFQWTDAETGLKCKARADWIGGGVLLDLKTTSKLAPRMWPAEVARRLYHAQLAFYLDGAHAAGLGNFDGVIIGVESAKPHDVGAWVLDGDAIYCGQLLYREWLSRLVECQRTGIWPGMYPEEEVLSLPAWALDDDDSQKEAA